MFDSVVWFVDETSTNKRAKVIEKLLSYQFDHCLVF